MRLIPAHRGLGDMMLAWEDSYIAMQNAVTAAWALGIGSCYIGHVIEHYEETRELFGLPDYVVPTGLLVFGYPTEKQLAREKFSHFQWEDMVCENHYREKSPEEFRTMLEERQKKSGKDFDTWAKNHLHSVAGNFVISFVQLASLYKPNTPPASFAFALASFLITLTLAYCTQVTLKSTYFSSSTPSPNTSAKSCEPDPVLILYAE